jgi:hypothetical protein
LAQVWQAATARAKIAPNKRRDATLIIDEAQNFLTLANSPTRCSPKPAYRLSLVLAHQDLAQFPKDLLAAASANARNKIYFSCAPEDARVLARHTLPELDEHDLLCSSWLPRRLDLRRPRSAARDAGEPRAGDGDGRGS